MIDVSGQNMTEGEPTGANRAADIFIGQEVPRDIQSEMKENGKRTYRPRRDNGQSISWDPEVLRATDTGYRMFHRSGEAEGWKIRTPIRGIIYVKGYLVESDIKVVVAGWWAINGWGKDDAEGPFRRHIAEDLTLPVVRDFIKRMHRQNRTIIMEADSNNVRWPARLPEMQLLNPGRTLDHAWISAEGDLKMTPRGVWDGPKTGVGPDMQHRSVNFGLIRR